jgi:hypothetical protein
VPWSDSGARTGGAPTGWSRRGRTGSPPWIASIVGTNPRAVYMSADMTYTRTGQGWRIQAIVIHHGMRLLGSAP